MSKTTELRLKEFLNELSKLSNKYELYLAAGYANFDDMINCINICDKSQVLIRDIHCDFGSGVYK